MACSDTIKGMIIFYGAIMTIPVYISLAVSVFLTLKIFKESAANSGWHGGHKKEHITIYILTLLIAAGTMATHMRSIVIPIALHGLFSAGPVAFSLFVIIKIIRGNFTDKAKKMILLLPPLLLFAFVQADSFLHLMRHGFRSYIFAFYFPVYISLIVSIFLIVKALKENTAIKNWEGRFKIAGISIYIITLFSFALVVADLMLT